MQPTESHRLQLDYGRPPAATPRTVVALGLGLPAGAAAGFVLTAFDSHFLAAWFFLAAACPVLPCVVTDSRHVRAALIPGPAMAVSYGLFQFIAPFGSTPKYTTGMELLVMTLKLTLATELVALAVGAAYELWRPEDVDPPS